MNTKTHIHFTPSFVEELTAKAQKLTARECELMANVGIRRQFEKDTDEASIKVLEDIYWIVAMGKLAAERAG